MPFHYYHISLSLFPICYRITSHTRPLPQVAVLLFIIAAFIAAFGLALRSMRHVTLLAEVLHGQAVRIHSEKGRAKSESVL